MNVQRKFVRAWYGDQWFDSRLSRKGQMFKSNFVQTLKPVGLSCQGDLHFLIKKTQNTVCQLFFYIHFFHPIINFACLRDTFIGH